LASQIDATKPVDGLPAVKAELRANLAAAKGEIEALQSGKADTGHVHALADSAVSASRELVLADGASQMLRVDSTEPVTLTVPPASSATFPSGTVITMVRWGSGALAVEPGPGVTLHKPTDRGSAARARYSVIGLWEQATDVWLLYGDLT
jgi:hypothetical protein